MAPTFLGILGCVQIRIFSSVMIECASNLEGIPCFVPIHCLPFFAKNNVKQMITTGLSTILKKAETTKWNGKKYISLKTQNIIDPFLAALYNTYSLSAALTDPYHDCSLPPPDKVTFTIDVTYIPEGENDNCKLEVLIHDELEIVLFIWKEFQKYGSLVFLRHTKTTWTLNATNGTLYRIDYLIVDNRMQTCAGELEKRVGWPRERMSIDQMIEEANIKMNYKLTKLSHQTYKWIQKVPIQYLHSMDIDLEESNSDGVNLLHVLAEMNETKNMKCLLGKIRNIDPVDLKGETPLHRACANSCFKAAKILIEFGANVNALTDNGDSPLTLLAAQKQHDISLLRMMLDQNAKREHGNKDSMRAVDLVRQTSSNTDIIKLLGPV